MTNIYARAHRHSYVYKHIVLKFLRYVFKSLRPALTEPHIEPSLEPSSQRISEKKVPLLHLLDLSLLVRISKTLFTSTLLHMSHVMSL